MSHITPFWLSAFHNCHFGLIRLTRGKKKRDYVSPIKLLLSTPKKKTTKLPGFLILPKDSLERLAPPAPDRPVDRSPPFSCPLYPSVTHAEDDRWPKKKKKKRDGRSPIKLLLPHLGTLVRFTPKKKPRGTSAEGTWLVQPTFSPHRMCLPTNWPTALPIRRPAF